MKAWLMLLFSGQPGVSSKRVFGGIGLIWMGIIITISEHQFIPEFLLVCAGLLGIETISGIFRRSSTNNPGAPPATTPQDPPLDP